MQNTLAAVPVKRDTLGYWTHPDFFTPANGSELGVDGEFDAWLQKNHLRAWHTFMTDEDDSEESMYQVYEKSGQGDCSHWTPSDVDEGKGGWFMASIHDSDYGPVCVWLRSNTDE
ncbi:hypothetical protein ACLMPQ_21405 [Yersinia enterocolitica]|uniref:hypothetical protein n=1 Tax=Yersinia enterocolitica TaxID=630 RepID=UPI00398CE7E2